jgi:hypothetical protein
MVEDGNSQLFNAFVERSMWKIEKSMNLYRMEEKGDRRDWISESFKIITNRDRSEQNRNHWRGIHIGQNEQTSESRIESIKFDEIRTKEWPKQLNWFKRFWDAIMRIERNILATISRMWISEFLIKIGREWENVQCFSNFKTGFDYQMIITRIKMDFPMRKWKSREVWQKLSAPFEQFVRNFTRWSHLNSKFQCSWSETLGNLDWMWLFMHDESREMKRPWMTE